MDESPRRSCDTSGLHVSTLCLRDGTNTRFAACRLVRPVARARTQVRHPLRVHLLSFTNGCCAQTELRSAQEMRRWAAAGPLPSPINGAANAGTYSRQFACQMQLHHQHRTIEGKSMCRIRIGGNRDRARKTSSRTTSWRQRARAATGACVSPSTCRWDRD